MKDIQQLIKKNSQEGRYEDIFPKTFIDAVLDKESGVTLTDILAMFNMLFLSYNGSRSQTRLQVPSSLRRKGLWVTYVLYDKTVVTEWYSAEAIDDTTFGDSANWRDGSNALVGDISISLDGYWVINGEVTNIKAQGEAGITPILRVGSNNHLQVSYTNGSSYVDVSSNPVFTQFRVSNNKLQQSTDLGESWSNISEELAYKFRESGNKIQMSKDLGNTWEDVSDYIAAWFRFTGTTGSSQADNVGKMQISRDNGATWADLSGEFTNSLYIKGYVATVGTLPSSAVQGDIYGVGPTYDPSDTEHTNPIYQLYVKDSTGWVNNGRFTSIAAGVVQELGNSETEVMSQKAVTNIVNNQYKLNDILEAVDVTENQLIPIEVDKVVGILTNRGVLDTSYNSFSTTDYVSIELIKSYYFKPNSSMSDSFCHIVFYDENKTMIYGVLGRSVNSDSYRLYKLMRPFNAAYFRVTGQLNNVVLYSTPKVESIDNIIRDEVLNDTLVGGINLFDKGKVILNTYLDPETGTVSPSTNFFISDYINVAKLQNISITQFGSNASYALYDYNKVLLSFGYINTITDRLNVSNAYYVRISGASATSILDAIMVCNNYLPSTYVPYNMVDRYSMYDINNSQYWEQLDCPVMTNASIIPTTYTEGIFGASFVGFETSDFISTHATGTIHYYYCTSTYGAGLSKMEFYDKDKIKIGAVNGAALVPYKNVLLRLHYPRGCEYVKYARQTSTTTDGIYTVPYTSFEDAVNSVITPTSKETVLWVGTSIPEGSTYPLVSCSKNGYNCINNAYGQSRLCFTSNPTTVTTNSGRELTATVQELKNLYQSHVGIEITQQEFNQWLDKSYERSVLPYISGTSITITDGTTNVPGGVINPNKIKISAIVIDHGYNDYNSVNSLMENPSTINWLSTDRGNFVGAFNYLVNKIQEVSPTTKIIVGGYFNYTLESSNKPLGKNLCDLQTLISQQYNFELLDVWNYTQISWRKFIKGTINYMADFNAKYDTSYVVPTYGKDADGNIRSHFVYCPDGIHPHSDLTGNCNIRLNAVYTKLLRSIV